VTPLTHESILLAFMVFCRVGACFMVLPGISGARIPGRFRLFLSIAVALAIMPLVTVDLQPAIETAARNPLHMIATETITGLLLGFLVRFLFLALEFSAAAMANFLGYGSVFMQSIDSNDAAAPITAMISLPAMALFFILDQHVRMIEVLQNSYVTLPPDHPFDVEPTMRTIVATLVMTFKLALQLCAPLLIYSLSINVLFGLMNKMIPQIPVYFLSAPFLMFGGFIILYLLVGPMLSEFSAVVDQAIVRLGRDG
jgi:flagellar biosynthetic protein FliR